MNEAAKSGNPWAVLSLLAGGLGCVTAIFLSLTIVAGQHLRGLTPVYTAAAMLLVIGATVLVGVPSGIVGCFRRERRLLAVAGLVLSLVCFPLAMAVLNLPLLWQES